MSKAYPVRVADGGRLVTALSLENVGELNWSRKLNMRRFKDREIRQEGWVKFIPVAQDYPIIDNRLVIGDTAVLTADSGILIQANATGGTIGVWVPDPSTLPDGWYAWITKIDAAANDVTVYQGTYPDVTTPLGSTLSVQWNGMFLSVTSGAYTVSNLADGAHAPQYIFDGSENLLRLAELVRPNGDRVIVGASRTKIKKFDTSTKIWTDISGGLTFSGSGKRWQAETQNGYLILNNTVNLPVSYRVEDDTVTPIYELRQVGVAAVERIKQFNGFLILGNVLEIKEDQLDPWMNGYSNYTALGPTAKVANFSVVFATDHQKEFDVTTGSSTITATLPAMAFSSQPFYIWLKKADAGSGKVVTSPLIADQEISLVAQNDKALIWWNGSAWAAKYFAGGTIPATDPYGTPPADIVQRIPYEVVTGEFGQPTQWAPLFDALMPSASANIVLPFVPSTWVAGQTRVAVINGGPAGETLGGQSGYENGILITAIGAFDAAKMGVQITLEESTDSTLTYPLVVQVTRWDDISTLVARYLLQDDGSGIIGMEILGQLLMLYRDTCIYIGRYTGDATNPFVFVPRYPGKESLNLPLWGDAIANVNGQYHLYPGIGNRFYKFDGVSWPTIHEVADDAKELFFNGLAASAEPFAMANFATKQIWFCNGRLTYAYDIEFNTVNEINQVVDAGCFSMKPGGADRWFILALFAQVYVYGLVNGADPIHTWLRDGLIPTAQLTSGLISAGLPGDEKMLLNYTPVLASPSGNAACTVQLRSTYNPSGVLTDLLSPVESLPNPAGETFFGTYFQALFFQDEIILTDTRDIDFQISARVFEMDRVGDARGITRAVGLA